MRKDLGFNAVILWCNIERGCDDGFTMSRNIKSLCCSPGTKISVAGQLYFSLKKKKKNQRGKQCVVFFPNQASWYRISPFFASLRFKFHLLLWRRVKGIRMGHPKIWYFGIRMIRSRRHWKVSRCRKEPSWSFPYGTESRNSEKWGLP